MVEDTETRERRFYLMNAGFVVNRYEESVNPNDLSPVSVSVVLKRDPKLRTRRQLQQNYTQTVDQLRNMGGARIVARRNLWQWLCGRYYINGASLSEGVSYDIWMGKKRVRFDGRGKGSERALECLV